MSKIGEPKVRFLSLSSLQTSRGGLLLAESALFTLLYMLIVADSGTRRRAIAFFSSLYAFCHLADLRFSFSFHSFSHQSARSPAPAEPFHGLQRVARRSPAEARRMDSRLRPQVGTRAL